MTLCSQPQPEVICPYAFESRESRARVAHEQTVDTRGLLVQSRSARARIRAHARVHATARLETIEFRSRFSEIVPDERIVFTCELVLDGRLRSVSLASVELAREAGGTRLTYTEHYVFVALTGDGTVDRAEREQGTRLQLNGLQAILQ